MVVLNLFVMIVFQIVKLAFIWMKIISLKDALLTYILGTNFSILALWMIIKTGKFLTVVFLQSVKSTKSAIYVLSFQL